MVQGDTATQWQREGRGRGTGRVIVKLEEGHNQATAQASSNPQPTTTQTPDTHLPLFTGRLLGVPGGSPLVMTTKGNGWSSSQFRPLVLEVPAAMINTVSLVGRSPPGGFQCRSDLRASKKEGEGEGVGLRESGDGVADGDGGGVPD